MEIKNQLDTATLLNLAITKVHETYSVSEVNSYTHQGWHLLATAEGVIDNKPCVLFSLGRPKEVN